MKIKKQILNYIKDIEDRAIDDDGNIDPDYEFDEGEQAELMILEWVLETDEDIRDIGRRIICAALRYEEGDIVIGPRHFCPMMRIQLIHHSDKPIPEQGFIDQYGRFFNREEAWTIAEEAGQIIRRVGDDENKLYSENLY